MAPYSATDGGERNKNPRIADFENGHDSQPGRERQSIQTRAPRERRMKLESGAGYVKPVDPPPVIDSTCLRKTL